MAKKQGAGRQNWSDHPFVVVLTVLTALITIYLFVKENLVEDNVYQPPESDSVKPFFESQTSKGEPSNNDSVGGNRNKSQTIENARLVVEVSREVGNIEIYIDDSFFCSTPPCTTYLPRGTYTVKAGYFDKMNRQFKFSKKINVLENTTIRISAHEFRPE